MTYFLHHSGWSEKDTVTRYSGFGTQGTVKTTWPPFAFLEFVACHLNPFSAGFQLSGRSYPANPVPARRRRDLPPQGIRPWIGFESILQIIRYWRFRPIFRRINSQHDSITGTCLRCLTQSIIDPEPVTSPAVWLKDSFKRSIIDGALDKYIQIFETGLMSFFRVKIHSRSYKPISM
jgi:hypothetical protein